MPTPRFSVIIPTYNRRERLLRAVRSVLAQRFEDFEVVVVDDGSTDGSLDALAELTEGAGSAAHPRVVALRQQNGGPAAARTAGARAATGEYLAFLDSDDVWFPWTLDTLERVLRAHGPLAWLYGSGRVERSAPATRSSSLPSLLDTRASGPEQEPPPLAVTVFADYAAAAAADGLMPLPTGVAIRRDVFQAAGGFRTQMRVGEDLDLWFRIAEERGFARIDSPALYVREVHDGSLGEDVERSYAGMMDLVEREHERVYPGTTQTAFTRRAILSRQLMYYAGRYRQEGRPELAARVYFEVLRLQAAGGFREPTFGGRRNHFLATFPLYLVSPRLHAYLRAGHARAFGANDRPPSAAHDTHDRG